MTDRVLDCREAIRLLAAYLDGELDEVDHGLVERHLDICRDCYSRAEFERRLKAQLEGLGRQPVEPSFEHRIRGMIRRFRDEPDAERAPDPT